MSQLLFITGCFATHNTKAKFIYRFDEGAGSVGADPEQPTGPKKAPQAPFISTAIDDARNKVAADAYEKASNEGLDSDAALKAAEDTIAATRSLLGSVDPQKGLAAKETAESLQRTRIRTFHELLRNAQENNIFEQSQVARYLPLLEDGRSRGFTGYGIDPDAQHVVKETLGGMPDLRSKMRELQVDDNMKAFKTDAELTRAVLLFAANLPKSDDLYAKLAGKNRTLQRILGRNKAEAKNKKERREGMDEVIQELLASLRNVERALPAKVAGKLAPVFNEAREAIAGERYEVNAIHTQLTTGLSNLYLELGAATKLGVIVREASEKYQDFVASDKSHTEEGRGESRRILADLVEKLKAAGRSERDEAEDRREAKEPFVAGLREIGTILVRLASDGNAEAVQGLLTNTENSILNRDTVSPAVSLANLVHRLEEQNLLTPEGLTVTGEIRKGTHGKSTSDIAKTLAKLSQKPQLRGYDELMTSFSRELEAFLMPETRDDALQMIQQSISRLDGKSHDEIAVMKTLMRELKDRDYVVEAAVPALDDFAQALSTYETTDPNDWHLKQRIATVVRRLETTEITEETLVASATAAPTVKRGRRLGAARSGGGKGGRAFDAAKATPDDIKERAADGRAFLGRLLTKNPQQHALADKALGRTALNDDNDEYFVKRVTTMQEAIVRASPKNAALKALVDKNGGAGRFVDGRYGPATFEGYKIATKKEAPAATKPPEKAPEAEAAKLPELGRIERLPKVAAEKVVALPNGEVVEVTNEVEKARPVPGEDNWMVRYLDAKGQSHTAYFSYHAAERFVGKPGESHVVSAVNKDTYANYLRSRREAFNAAHRVETTTELMKLKPELFTDAKFEATVPAGTPTIFFGSNGAVLKTRNFQLEKTVGVLGKSGNFYKVIRSNGLITYVPQASITPVARARKSKEK